MERLNELKLTEEEVFLIKKYRESKPYSRINIQKQHGKIQRITIEDSYMIEKKD